MAHSKSNTVDGEKLLSSDGRTHLTEALPDTWSVDTFDPNHQAQSIDATLRRDDDSYITISAATISGDRLVDFNGNNPVIVHRVEFTGPQTGSYEVAEPEDAYDAEQAAREAVDYATENRETALCGAENLRRRFYLLLGDRFGKVIENQQRQWEEGPHGIGPVWALVERDEIPVRNEDDLIDATQSLAKNALTALNDSPWNYEYLTTDEGIPVALVDTFKDEIVRRTSDATVNQYISAGLCHENAFTQAVLAELGERYGERFVEKAEELEQEEGWFVIDVARRDGFANTVERNRVGSAVEAVAEEIFEELREE